ncbi:Crp/Fnr family transcriptional regulator [Flagellimonas lutimaris]|uniref:Crp/Fnr family transcriptional regulator n=1 Tax=Flagellimonas lutimaris TaxID=475082 RepID=UPI003F5CBCC3
MNISAFLGHIKNAIPLSKKEELFLVSKIKHRKYLKGQYILQQGDICNFLNFIISGATRTFHIDPEGNEYIFRFAIENWWATDLPSFTDQVTANTNIQCLVNTQVIQISKKDIEELYLNIPSLEHFFRLLFQRVSITLEKRIITNLSLSAKEKYLLFKEEYQEFEQRIPQYMIASYLGISKQYLSEIRNQLVSNQKN